MADVSLKNPMNQTTQKNLIQMQRFKNRMKPFSDFWLDGRSSGKKKKIQLPAYILENRSFIIAMSNERQRKHIIFLQYDHYHSGSGLNCLQLL